MRSILLTLTFLLPTSRGKKNGSSINAVHPSFADLDLDTCIPLTKACPLTSKDPLELTNKAVSDLLPKGALEESLSCLYTTLSALDSDDYPHISSDVTEIVQSNVNILCSSLRPFQGAHLSRRLIHNFDDLPLKWPPLTAPLAPPPARDKAIFTMDGLLTPTQCADVIDLFEASALHEGNLLSGGKIIIDRKGKNRWEFDMSASAEDYPDTWGAWDRVFIGATVQALQEYERANPIVRTLKSPLGDEGFRVIRYHANSTSEEPEQHMWHADGGQEARGSHPRLLAAIMYLNTPTEGGETAFLNQGFAVTPQCGRILIFPSAFPYVHGGRPVAKGSKYAVVLMITL
jgi:hypothetical protein